jgi:hypothetical protein
MDRSQQRRKQLLRHCEAHYVGIVAPRKIAAAQKARRGEVQSGEEEGSLVPV